MREVKIIPIKKYVTMAPNENTVIIPYHTENEILNCVKIARRMRPDRITVDCRYD